MCGSLWMRAQHPEKGANRVKQNIRALIKKRNWVRGGLHPHRKSDAKQQTKAEVCWHMLCQRCGSEGKPPGMLEDWLQSRKAHPRSTSLMPLASNVPSACVRTDIRTSQKWDWWRPEYLQLRKWERKKVSMPSEIVNGPCKKWMTSSNWEM